MPLDVGMFCVHDCKGNEKNSAIDAFLPKKVLFVVIFV